jgi:undecaprenyl-diphosphatase
LSAAPSKDPRFRGNDGWAATAALALLFIVAAAFALHPVPAESTLFRWAAGLGAPFAPWLLPLTRLGNLVLLGPLALAAAIWLAIKARYRAALWLLATCIVARLVTAGLKLVFQRPRPDLLPQLDQVYSMSFPSAHAANTMATFLAIALALGGRAPIVGAVALTLAIGISRVLLAVHWPSDVVGGWALGAFCVSIAARWLAGGDPRAPAAR